MGIHDYPLRTLHLRVNPRTAETLDRLADLYGSGVEEYTAHAIDEHLFGAAHVLDRVDGGEPTETGGEDVAEP